LAKIAVAWEQALAGLAAVLGHVFPIWLGFRGGKGVATGFGVFLVAAPPAALAAIALFAIILLITRYVSLASIFATLSFPILSWFLVADHSAFFVAVEITVALLIVVKHHANVNRLLNGTESRIGARKPA